MNEFKKWLKKYWFLPGSLIFSLLSILIFFFKENTITTVIVFISVICTLLSLYIAWCMKDEDGVLS
jgi:hypothetical protein